MKKEPFHDLTGPLRRPASVYYRDAIFCALLSMICAPVTAPLGLIYTVRAAKAGHDEIWFPALLNILGLAVWIAAILNGKRNHYW